ncbi:hypothetical protein OS493_033382, partial [Desmophyllum pertusum]
MNLLNEISVGNQATRVEVIPFGLTASKFIDQNFRSPLLPKNKCTFNEKFKPMPHSINGYMTNTKDAFEKAWEVCLNNGFEEIRSRNVNFPQLQSLVSDKDIVRHFYLKDFTEFGELATYIRGECTPSTYKAFKGYAETCTACPANSGHQLTGSQTILDCKCFTGYRGKPDNGEDCTIIRCPIQTVINADLPTGNCTDTGLVYKTECSYACRTGYNQKGSKKIACQLDKNWSPAAPTCEHPYEAVWQVDGVDSSKCNKQLRRKGRMFLWFSVRRLPMRIALKGFCRVWLVGQMSRMYHHQPTRTLKAILRLCTACPANSGHQWTGSQNYLGLQVFLQDIVRSQENGEDCTIRNCETLTAPANGIIIGNCYNTYGTSCTFECLEGYELTGTATRTCTVKALDTMGWTGTTVTCTVIRCPIQTVINADPPTGTCTDPGLVYKTDCSYACRTGYNLKGSKKIACQLDKSWSPALPTCEQVTCPALPKAAVGTYIPATCDVGESGYPSNCELRCPSGYHISYLPTSIMSDQRTCELNGTWEYRASTPTCK